MDRLIVATDFSSRSDRALRRATLLAHKLGASLTLVHIIDGDRPDRLIASERAAASLLLEDHVETLRTVDAIESNWIVKADDVHAGIMAAAEEIDAGLIIIGPHRSRLRDVFVGTTAERVVRQSRRPLLVAVGTPAAHHRNTLLALDFDEASKTAGRTALRLGIFEHTDVVIMHAFDAPAEGMLMRTMAAPDEVDEYVEAVGEAATEKLQALIGELGLPPTCRTISSMKGSPARTIMESAEKVGSDLIVLGTNQRHGFERILVGSVTADVIHDAHRDVLIIPVDQAE